MHERDILDSILRFRTGGWGHPHARGASQIFSTGGVAVDAVEKREKGEAALESGHTGEVDVEVSGVFARVCLAFKGGPGRRRSLGAERDFAAL